MTFQPGPEGKPPTIERPLSDTLGEKGRSVTLECEISGTPRPEYHWYRGTRELVDTSKYTITSKGDVQVFNENRCSFLS